mgnify:CR=1 FL=1|jgi:hypothetical protein
MSEIIDSVVTQIEQIIFWLKVGVYLFIGICVVWLVGFVRRNLGMDAHSIELRRIRRLLEAREVNNTTNVIKGDKETKNERFD